jgi:hypothetical protein
MRRGPPALSITRRRPLGSSLALSLAVVQINDASQIVGYYVASSGGTYGFVTSAQSLTASAVLLPRLQYSRARASTSMINLEGSYERQVALRLQSSRANLNTHWSSTL